MVTLITVLNKNKTCVDNFIKLIKNSKNDFDKIIFFCENKIFDLIKSSNEKIKKIGFDEDLKENELFDFFTNKIKQENILDFEVNINLNSMNNKICMCLTNSIMKNGLGFKFIYFDEEKNKICDFDFLEE